MSYDQMRPVAVAILSAAMDAGDDGVIAADVMSALADMGAVNIEPAMTGIDVPPELPATWEALQGLLQRSAQAAWSAAENALLPLYGELIGTLAVMFRQLAIEAAPFADAREFLQRIAAEPDDGQHLS